MYLSLLTLASLVSLTIAAPTPARSLNSIIVAVGNYLPFISGAISDVAGLISDAEITLAALTGTPTSHNGLSDGCAEMIIIFARGTADPGNVGFLTGPAWFDAVQAIIGSSNVAVQGVPYSASVTGFLEGGDPLGGPMMAGLVQQAFSQCPGAKIVLGGYSQGGQIVHNAAAVLPANVMAEVSAVVIFGDPDYGRALPNIDPARILVICHEGDAICAGTDLILPAHLTYAENAVQAATFVVGAAGL